MKDGNLLRRKQPFFAPCLRGSRVRLPWRGGGRFLIFLLLLTLPSSVQAQFIYTVANGEVTITGYTGAGGDLTIPGQLEGLPVTAIAPIAFAQHAGLTAVTVPDSVRSIGSQAFAVCPDLVNVTLGKGITNMGEAFSYLGSSPFQYCPNLSRVKVAPDNPAYLDVEGVLYDKSRSLLIKYPPAKISPSYAVPDSVTNIVASAFYGSSHLEQVQFGENVVAVGDYAFAGCTGLSRLSLDARLVDIGDRAFSYCAGLTGALSFGQITNIGSGAFEACSGLSSITLPQSLTAIGQIAFRDCTNLTSFTVDAGNPSFSSLEGVLFDRNRARLIQYPGGKAGTGYHIPTSVTTIGAFAFSGGAGTSSLTLPGNVSILEPNAFYGCRDLISVTLPDSVTIIPDSAFGECLRLTNVAMTSRVTSIGRGAFIDCGSLANFTVPSGVTFIDDQAFLICTNLLNFTVDAANPSYSTVDGVLFDGSHKRLLCYPGGRKDTAYVIPDGVVSIADSAFGGLGWLERVSFPLSLTNIERQAFGGCRSLLSVTIPPAAAVSEGAFSYCRSLTNITVAEGNPFLVSVDGVLFTREMTSLMQYPVGRRQAAYVIPYGVNQLDSYAFAGCTALTALTVPMNLVFVPRGAFEGCTGLKRIYFEGYPPIESGSFYGIPATLYHFPGIEGWPALLDGRPVVSWSPGIQTGHGGLGISAGHMGFTLQGAAGVPLVVEASEDLAQPNWVPVSTNTCNAEGLAQFSDPAGAGGAGRFYRFRPQ